MCIAFLVSTLVHSHTAFVVMIQFQHGFPSHALGTTCCSCWKVPVCLVLPVPLLHVWWSKPLPPPQQGGVQCGRSVAFGTLRYSKMLVQPASAGHLRTTFLCNKSAAVCSHTCGLLTDVRAAVHKTGPGRCHFCLRSSPFLQLPKHLDGLVVIMPRTLHAQLHVAPSFDSGITCCVSAR